MKAAAPSIFTLIRESTRKSSNLDAIRELLAEDPSLVNAVAPKKLADIRGMSPLQVALCTGWHADIAWYLLDHGADVNYRPEKKWSTESHPALFDAVNVALWNARRYAWDGRPTPPLNLVWLHTTEEADESFALLERMVRMGADVNQPDYDNRNALFEAVATANFLCPSKDPATGEFYPGKTMTPEMREDFRWVIGFLLRCGADTGCVSSFLKKTVAQYFRTEFVWTICGDLFE